MIIDFVAIDLQKSVLSPYYYKLIELGAEPGDKVRILDFFFEYR